MKIRSKVFKRKSGRNEGSWVARVEYEDETGRMRSMERHAASKGAANDHKDKLIDDIKKSHGHIRTGDKMTFNDLADYCEKHFYKEAKYVDGRRVSGVRSLQSAKSSIKPLRAYFGKQRLKSIYQASVREYKAHRLGTPIEVKSEDGTAYRPRKIATVNRELTILRRMLKVALSEGWILRDPFLGAAVISPADEEKRERILTRDEEDRLLAACRDYETTVEARRYGKTYAQTVQIRRSHLRPLIILALDTGMRRGELFKLRWEDVDFDRGMIFVCATHTKTQRERIVPLTPRAAIALRKLKTTGPSENIFPFTDVKIAFQGARDEAGLSDVRFHDLRHTAITRLIRGGMSAGEVGKMAGHTQPTTTYRYINTDVESIRTAVAILDGYSGVIPLADPLEIETIQ